VERGKDERKTEERGANDDDGEVRHWPHRRSLSILSGMQRYLLLASLTFFLSAMTLA
jgi:hypothetical protein